ncbi:hypothetical protein GCM10022243_00680 [Saccharothrix violaceirubra]|uniref:Uncharacterized protein n=1 Tax=Saccharothrix violaceirubra TaxID=413306 RepID=A0A7W7T2K2_9PSEU|nr:hypothetical protein [Saccharothrix violaceirubra]MBB4965437.1 hypothetical protein [Saccharothrix violaceirubra]
MKTTRGRETVDSKPGWRLPRSVVRWSAAALPAILGVFVGAGPVPAMAYAPETASAVRDAAAIHHVPTVPLSINGRPVPGETILAYNGYVLHMAYFPGSDGAPGRLHTFTTPDALEKFVHSRGGPEHALAKPSKHANPDTPGVGWRVVGPGARGGDGVSSYGWDTTGSIIFEHMEFSGCGLFLEKNYGYQRLTHVYGCMWPNDWNDETSSVKNSPYGSTATVLYEHTYYNGSTLYIPYSGFNHYLEGVGWNDRTSSFASI